MTTYWRIRTDHALEQDAEAQQQPQQQMKAISEAAQMLQAGNTVAFPTETVYGLGADAANSSAVSLIFAAKGRPSDNPLIVHIAHRSQLSGLVAPYDETLCRLMDAFWPGPLTLVLPVQTGVISPLVTAGLSTIGIRVPDHPIALSLLQAAGCPVAAPSANSSGRPSPTLAEHVQEDLDGKIGGIIDGGPTGVGLESTVVEWIDQELYILRPGGVTAEQLRNVLPEITIHEPKPKAENLSIETPHSPGMKYTHYAPKGVLQIVQGDSTPKVAEWIQQEITTAKRRGETTGILTFEEHQSLYQADLVVSCGSLAEPQTIAQGLYASLRQFDQNGITFILAEACQEEGIGAAIMNRLLKAAGHRVVHT